MGKHRRLVPRSHENFKKLMKIKWTRKNIKKYRQFSLFFINFKFLKATGEETTQRDHHF